MKKNIIIAILAIVCLIEFSIIGNFPSAPLSIKEKAQVLYASGYELDCNAVEYFAEDWNEYVESELEYTIPEIEEYH